MQHETGAFVYRDNAETVIAINICISLLSKHSRPKVHYSHSFDNGSCALHKCFMNRVFIDVVVSVLFGVKPHDKPMSCIALFGCQYLVFAGCASEGKVHDDLLCCYSCHPSQIACRVSGFAGVCICLPNQASLNMPSCKVSIPFKSKSCRRYSGALHTLAICALEASSFQPKRTMWAIVILLEALY